MKTKTIIMSNCGHSQTVPDVPEWTGIGYCEACLDRINVSMELTEDASRELTTEEWLACVEMADRISDYGFDRD
jgi:hypothetical protein